MNFAKHFNIIRSYQKDDFYRSKLRVKVRDLAQLILKPNQCFKIAKELNLLADTLYYLTTTLASRQTLGQEYCNLILYDQLRRNIPSTLKRALMIAIKIVLPYAFYRINFDNLYFDLFKLFYYYLNNFHSIFFFLTQSTFYKFENFLTNIRYLDISNIGASVYNTKKSYLLALSLFLPLIYNLYLDVRKIRKYLTEKQERKEALELLKSEKNAPKNERLPESSDRKCMLCLGAITEPTLTPCGHCFCWQCIHQYGSFKNDDNFQMSLGNNVQQCPICREKFTANRLVYLFNY